LGARHLGRKQKPNSVSGDWPEVKGANGLYELRKLDVSYKANFGGESGSLRPENTHFRNQSVWISITLLGPTAKAVDCYP
jgi:hypothetical protein